MKIHDREGFPNPARIRIVLAAKNLEHRVRFSPVDLIAAEHKQASFLALNPSGKVPVLELDDGTIITESTAITEYLDNLDGDPILTGKTALEKAMVHMMQRRAEAELLECVDGYFHYGTPGLGPAMVPYTAPEWEGRTEWAQRQRSRALRGMAHFDDVLQTRAFVVGPQFSMADITVFVALAFAEAAGLTIAPEHAALHAWRAKVAALPAVKNRSGQHFPAEDLKRFGF